MDDSTTSVTALGSCIEPWEAAAHSPALSGDGRLGANHKPTILSPSPPASPSTASRELVTPKPSVPMRPSHEKRPEASPVPSPIGGFSNRETGARGSSPLYEPVDLEPQQAPAPRSKHPVVEVELPVPGDFPRPKQPPSSSSTPGPSNRNTDSRGGTTPIHHALEVGALPRMISTMGSFRQNPRNSAETSSALNTPSVTGSASDKENADGKENGRRRSAVSPDSTLDGSTGSPPPPSRNDRPRSINARMAAAKPKRSEPTPTRMNEPSTSTKSSSTGRPAKRSRKSQATKNDAGMTQADAINIDSDSGGEH